MPWSNINPPANDYNSLILGNLFTFGGIFTFDMNLFDLYPKIQTYSSITGPISIWSGI